MKANINHELKIFQSVQDYWKRGNIYQFKIVNYPDLSSDTHYADGWRDVVIPTIGENQRVGQLIYDEPNDVVTYEVIDLTDDEIKAKKRALVPFSISKLQALLMLARMGLKDKVLDVVSKSGNEEVTLYFEHAATWERESPIINSFAPMIGLSQEDLDVFFTEAEKIS